MSMHLQQGSGGALSWRKNELIYFPDDLQSSSQRICNNPLFNRQTQTNYLISKKGRGWKIWVPLGIQMEVWLQALIYSTQKKNDNAGWDLNPAEDKPCKVCLNLGADGSFCREDLIQVNSLLGAPDKISLSDE